MGKGQWSGIYLFVKPLQAKNSKLGRGVHHNIDQTTRPTGPLFNTAPHSCPSSHASQKPPTRNNLPSLLKGLRAWSSSLKRAWGWGFVCSCRKMPWQKSSLSLPGHATYNPSSGAGCLLLTRHFAGTMTPSPSLSLMHLQCFQTSGSTIPF